MACSIRNYAGECCGGVRPFFPTGQVQNGYFRLVSGKVIRADGVDLTSGYRDRLLVPPNGSRAASQMYGMNEPALCC